MPLFLALDQSTSGTKALLFDLDGQAVDREARAHRQFYPQPGWVEHDADEIWQNSLGVLKALIARQSARTSEIVTLSITNQRETIVVFDRATGRPLHPAIVWQCRRGDSICADHAATGWDPLVHKKTGLKLDAYFSASKLQWLVNHRPELRAKLADGSALIGTVDTYLIYRLTGGKTFATDSTNASRTLLFDINRLGWDEELCGLWQVPVRALPEVRESSAQFGETTLDGGLPRPVPICGVMGDSQASLFAQHCFSSGSAKVTFGTGSSVLLTIGEKIRPTTAGVLVALAWVRGGVPVYAFEGIIISSASTLNWLRDQLRLVADIDELQKLSDEVDGAEGVHLVPAFTGLGLPHWNPLARAAITGLSSKSDRRHIARAALESIAFQVRDVVEAMCAEAEVPLAVLYADGGPTTNKFLMQFTADLVGTELRISEMPDCSALGAVFAGQLGLGFRRNLAELSARDRTILVYRPRLSRENADALYAGWKAAVRRVLTP